MPTVIGVIFLLLSLYCFLRSDSSLFGLVIASSIFHASSIISSENHGVEPYYFVALMYICQCLSRGRYFHATQSDFIGKNWLLVFSGVALVSSFTLPFVFAGVPVYDPYVGIDDGLFLKPPLHLGLANFTQSVYLCLDVLVVLGAARTPFGRGTARKAYLFAFYFLAFVIGVQFLCSVLHIAFPYALLQNHGGYGGVQESPIGDLSARYPGTFTEPSGAGLVLVTCAAGFLAERLKSGRSMMHALVALFAVFLVRSSGSLVALVVVFLLLLMAHPILRFPFHLRRTMLKRSALLLSLAAAAVFLAIASPLGESLSVATLGKQDSSSYINRTASDLYALELVLRTKGLGVGMGSNRPSSLLASLLSTVGVLGCVGFLVAYARLLMNAVRSASWLRWAGIALFLDMAVSGPDYTAPWIWVVLAMAVHFKAAPQQSSVLRALQTPEAVPG